MPEIQGLRYASGARFDANVGRDGCLGATRAEVLAAVYNWAIPREYFAAAEKSSPMFEILKELCILWLNGQAGTGKSTLAQTIAERCSRAGLLGASFFCSRFGDRNNIQLIFPTIAQQLALSNGDFLNTVKDTVAHNPDIHFSHPSYQLQKLLVDTLRTTPQESFAARIVIIDALDESASYSDRYQLLRILNELSTKLPENVHCIVTSRPENDVLETFVFEEGL